MIYLLQIFFDNSLLLLEDIQKFEEGVWFCFRDMIFWNCASIGQMAKKFQIFQIFKFYSNLSEKNAL